jgi:hypothetical protein
VSDTNESYELLCLQPSSSTTTAKSVIIEAGYLIRSVALQDTALHINGDINATVPLKVLGASNAKSLFFNNQQLKFTTNPVTGELSSTLTFNTPRITLPNLSTLSWKTIDSLPELQASYDDSAWTAASLTETPNPLQPLLTPTSLFGSDYGYNVGALVFRGHFVADGTETTLSINTQGGFAFGTSIWLNSTYIGSWTGIDVAEANNATYPLPTLVSGKSYIFTIVVDNNGMDENWAVGADLMKAPRGILDYDLAGRDPSVISWKLTGNLGGEQYIDKVHIFLIFFPPTQGDFHLYIIHVTLGANPLPLRSADPSMKGASSPSVKASHSPTHQASPGHPALRQPGSAKQESHFTARPSRSIFPSTTTFRSRSTLETRPSTELGPATEPSFISTGISSGSISITSGLRLRSLYRKVCVKKGMRREGFGTNRVIRNTELPRHKLAGSRTLGSGSFRCAPVEFQAGDRDCGVDWYACAGHGANT